MSEDIVSLPIVWIYTYPNLMGKREIWRKRERDRDREREREIERFNRKILGQHSKLLTHSTHNWFTLMF